jgi:hypothetical protein
METKWAPEEGHTASELADLSVAQFSELLARVYQGPLESLPWAGALELIRTFLGANYATLILRSPSSDRRGLMVHASESGPGVPGEASYNNYYYSLDPFVGLPADRVVTVDEVFGDTGWLSSRPTSATSWARICAPNRASNAASGSAAITSREILRHATRHFARCCCRI